MLSHFSCVPLFDTMDCSPPGSSVHGILQARILEWVAISFSSAKKAEVAKLWLWELDGEPTLFIFLTPWRGVCQLKVIGRSWGQLLFQMDTWADAAEDALDQRVGRDTAGQVVTCRTVSLQAPRSPQAKHSQRPQRHCAVLRKLVTYSA